jgi:hypothetical protein
MEKYHEKTVEYWKQNAEENYLTTPISVLKYITVLEEQAQQLRKDAIMCWVVYNTNGDVIGVADSYGKALSIYEERYGDTPEYPDERIEPYEINRLHYA